MMEMLELLCKHPARESREKVIRHFLDANDLRYELQIGQHSDGLPRNLIVTFNDNPTHRWIFGAHYDIDSKTLQGANDNSAAVIQLLQLAIDLGEEGYAGNLTICFWDLEELTGSGVSQGAYCFAKSLLETTQDDGCAEFVLVLDVCGVGDTIGISRSLFNEQHAGRFEHLLRIYHHPYQCFETPLSDNEGLRRGGLKSVLAVVLPQEEIGEKPCPKTWARLHSIEDDIENIWPQTMQMMRGYLRTWLRTLEGFRTE